MSALQVIWFLLIGVLLTGYAILDGFDLGVGIWHLFARDEEQRGVLLRSVGPVWDGNEVWLLTGAGALFAAFPPVYATVFSGLYLALMLVLFALIFRAVSFEFRGKVETAGWRRTWDRVFSLTSVVPALLFGVVIGNLLRRLPLDDRSDYAGTFLGLLNPYALLIGGVGFALFATQGALYAMLKTEGDLAARAKGWALLSWLVWSLLFLVASAVTLAGQPHLRENFHAFPLLWFLPLLVAACLGTAGLSLLQDRPGRAFVFSSLAIAGHLGLVGASTFPYLVRALPDTGPSLTIWNASSSQLTLTTMLILALIGVPIVLAYTIWVYRKFRGKVSAGGY